MSPWLYVGFGLFAIAVVALLIYGLLTRDKCGLPGIEKFDRYRIPVQLLPDHTLPIPIRAALNKAFNDWNEALGREVFVANDVRKGGSLVPLQPYTGHETPKQKKALAYVSLTLTEDRKGISGAAIYVDSARTDGVDATALRRALAHELGHVLGLAHDDLRESVMYRRALSEAAVITANDVAFIKEKYQLT